jgi:hypothetical protein
MPHNNEAVRELAIGKMIFSAKPGYNDPAQLEVPKITPEEKARIREKLENFQAI